MVDIIRELHGLGGLRTGGGHHPHSDRTPIDPHTPSGNKQRNSKGPRPSAPGWQEALRHALERKEAIFTLAAPAAGKTKPLIEATTSQLIIALNGATAHNSSHFPRVLYIAPRVQLANQVAINDFVMRPGSLLDIVLKYPGLFAAPFLNKLNSNRITPNDQRRVLSYIFNNLLGVVAGTGANIQSILSSEFRIKPIIAATYNHASRILDKYGKFIDRVIVDELQEFFPQPGKAHIIDEDKANDLSTIIDISMRSKKGLVLATGSVHVNTAQAFVDFLEKMYDRKVLFDKKISQTNRSKLTVVPFNGMKNASEVAELVKGLVKSNVPNTLFIVFSKTRTPTTGLGIPTIMEMLIKSLPIMHPDYFTQGNDRKTQSAGDFANSERQGKIRTEKPKHEESIRGRRVNITDDIQDLMYFDMNAILAKKTPVTTKANPDNLLFQSVIRGVGFIVGGMDPRHTATIQKLFMSKKLQVLFATDAIGVGANVDAKNLFLPNLDKFESGNFGPINSSSLIQLVNRAGRSAAIPYANIYVQEKDIDLVNSILERAPDIAADEIDLQLTSPLSVVPALKGSKTHRLRLVVGHIFK